jgi:hypothetical protein
MIARGMQIPVPPPRGALPADGLPLGASPAGGLPHGGAIARGSLICAVAATIMLCFGAAAARATKTTINFESPVISGSSSEGPLLTTQYESQGVVFDPNVASLPAPIGHDCNGVLFRDPADAHSGNQVAYSFCPAHGEDFENNAEIVGQLSTFTDEVSVYAGAPEITVNGIPYPGTQEETLTAYDYIGDVVATTKKKVGAKANTLLSVSASTDRIAYFTVGGPVGVSVPLEIDDLSFEVPSTPPSPQISLQTAPQAVGAQGQTVSVPVTVERFNGASNALELSISGLPNGVTLTGGNMVPAGSDTADLQLTVAANAAPETSIYTISGTSAGVSYIPTVQGTFYITKALAIVLEQNEDRLGGETQETISLGPCSNANVTITNLQVVPGSSTLSVAGKGDTAGLSTKLSATSVAIGARSTLSFSSNGTGGAGTATYTITATQGHLPAATATVTVERTGPSTAQGIYVTQGTQPDYGQLVPSGSGASGGSYQGVTLVAGKTTVARVYGDASGTPAGQPGAVALLYGYRNGKLLPGSPLEPNYGPATLADAHAAKEVVSDKELEGEANAYTFTLPPDWTSSGYVDRGDSFVEGTLFPAGQTIQLVGETLPYPGAGQLKSCHTSDSFTLNNVSFRTVGANYDNVIYPIEMTVKGKSPSEPSQVFKDVEAALPIPNGYMEPGFYIGSADISDIAANSKESPQEKNESVLGRLEEDYPNTEHAVGVTLGTAYGVTNGVPGSFSVVNGNGSRPVTSVAHEISHQFGLVHASPSCGGGSNGQKAEAWPPDERGRLNGIALNTTSEPYTFIGNGLHEEELRNDGFKEELGFAFDYMSYCAHVGAGDPNDWISPRNWEQLVANFGASASTASVGSVASVGSTAAGEETVSSAARRTARDPFAALAQVHSSEMRVIGFYSNGALKVTNVGPQVGPAIAHGTPNPAYTLLARGPGGRTIASVPMSAMTGGHIMLMPMMMGGGMEGQMEGVSFVKLDGEVPSGGVQELQVAVNGKVMATRTRPAHAPKVRVLAPRGGSRVGGHGNVVVRWSSTNPEHLRLTAAIDYSGNGGRTWRTIFAGPDSGRASLSSFFFAASRNARVRVRVNDGWDDTDAISKRFVALGAPPKVEILTRFAHGMSLAGDAQLPLLGRALDQSGRLLSGKSLRWYDGAISLGHGATISAGPLPAGVNDIRLVARGASGRTASASLRLTVNPVKLLGLALTIPKHLSRHAHKLTFRAAASTPTTLTINGHKFQLGEKSASFSLPVVAGKAPLLLAITVATEGVTTPFAAELSR